MMFKTALVGLLASAASAKSFIPDGSISATSTLGNKLMKKAKMLEAPEPRHLEQAQEARWIAEYDIKYTGCSSLTQVLEEGGGQDQYGPPTYQMGMITFSLCPPNTCTGSCKGGGLYAVSMTEFLQAYSQAKEEELEQQCEAIENTCYCNNNNNEEYCLNQCYEEAGLSACIEVEGQERFELEKYVECANMEAQNDNNQNQYNNNQNNGQNNYNYNNNNNGEMELFVGPYCASDGKSIHLGLFYNEGCSTKADLSLYEKANWGQPLPYSAKNEPIIPHGECMSCEQVDEDQNNYNNNNNQNNYNYNNQNDKESIELCQQSYEEAAKCETGMDIYYADSSGCEFIKTTLPRLHAASTGGMSGGSTSTALAWVFGITTGLFGAYAYFLYRKIKRGSVTLASQDGVMVQP